MVECRIEATAEQAQIVLRPNRSWTWRANLVLFYTLATVSISIGMSFLLQGLWLILPFNLLELTVLFLCLRYLLRRTRRQEVITFTDAAVCIECGAATPDEVNVYERHWAQFHVTPARAARRQQIAIRSRGREQRIGSFLNDDDQQRLIAELRRIVQWFATPAHIRAARFPNESAANNEMQ